MEINESEELFKCMFDPQYWIDNYGYCFNAENMQVGSMNCYQYQKDAIEMFEENQNSIVLKSRQCLPSDTFVDTPNGPKAIQDFKTGDELYSYNLKTNQIETDTIYDAWKSGERQCVKIKLKDSRYFEVGENHPFWIKNKQSWIKAKDIERGDEILDAEIVFGEINAKPEEVKLLVDLMTDKKTEFKILPEKVFNWDKESVSLLINRMFAGDGWISILKKKSNNNHLELGIASPSKLFLEQIRTLLKKFSIKCNIYEVKNEHFEIIANLKHDVTSSSIVQKVEKTSIKTCYDISVTKNENFLINGLLTHNTGFSVISAAYIAWTVLFKSDQKILILANDLISAVRLLKTVKDFIINTPAFLLPDSQIKANERLIEFSNGSWVKAVACSPQAGRGESLTLLVVDEVAFIENGDDIKAGALMATSKTGGKTIMISTPNGTGNLYHQYWTASVKGENNYKRLIAHWTQNPTCIAGLEKRIDGETGKQYDWSIWYQEQCERLGWDKVKIAQELDLSFESSKYLAVDSMIISKYKDDVKNSTPICYFDYNQYTLNENCFTPYATGFWIYEMPIKDHSYVIGVDVAGGTGKDYSTIQIIDAVTLIQVAEFQGKITSDKFADIILPVAKMYNDAFVAIEVNNMGITTAYYLHKTLGYKNVYKSKSIEELWAGPRESRFKVEVGDEIPGFRTTSMTRPFLMSTLITYMREKQVKINSPRLLNEFDTFVIKADGRAEHERGGNDDLIFAFAIALFIRQTEWEKLSKGKKMFKSIMESMTSSQSPYAGNNSKTDEILRKKAQSKDFLGTPLFIFGSESYDTQKEDDNTDWLFQ